MPLDSQACPGPSCILCACTRSALAQAMRLPLIGEISARASSRPSVRQLVPPYSNCGRGNSKVLLRLCFLGKHVPVPVGTVLATEETQQGLVKVVPFGKRVPREQVPVPIMMDGTTELQESFCATRFPHALCHSVYLCNICLR